ncbi:hypothetical protein BKA64DRAFT_635687 [Cadophora sp. MPI-SDFR-AT-0126]|nr:hypothetical protein BKA64DRAFT_635687 [Leotiomycetes sp. MPI-SDFR-AT-0126]
MPISLAESENPDVWNTDPLSNYSAFHTLLEKYRSIREEDKLLVGNGASIAAQRILDIDEDVKESYGSDTEPLHTEPKSIDESVRNALNHYRKKIRLFGWAIEPEVLWHCQMLVKEGRESDEIEERQRQELHSCRTDFKTARDAIISHLGSYVTTVRRHNEASGRPKKPVDKRVLTVVEAISKWADGDHEKVATDRFLRSENLRNWGYAGYMAKIASIYYWALRKTDEL